RVAAHREAADVGLGNLQVIEDSQDVVGGAILRVGGGRVGHVGGRIAPRVVGDGAVASGEEAHLQVPALVVARDLVNEDQGGALARLLVEQLDPADVGERHGLAPIRVTVLRIVQQGPD